MDQKRLVVFHRNLVDSYVQQLDADLTHNIQSIFDW